MKGVFFYQGKTLSAHVPDELSIPSQRLLTQLPINAICDVHKWLQRLSQAKQHVDFHSLLSWVKYKLVTENRCEGPFNLELFHPGLEVFPGLYFSEGYRPSLCCVKNYHGHERSVFWQCASKSHSFLSAFGTTFIQIQILRHYFATQKLKKDSQLYLSTDQPLPKWEEENYTKTSGAFVILVWVIKRQRKRRWIFHPTEMHMAVAGRTSFFHYSHLRRSKSF